MLFYGWETSKTKRTENYEACDFFGKNIRSLKKIGLEVNLKSSEYADKPSSLVFKTVSRLTDNDLVKTFTSKDISQLDPYLRNQALTVVVFLENDLEVERIQFKTKLECLVVYVMFDNLNFQLPSFLRCL